MPHPRMDKEEVARLAKEIYEQKLRDTVETEENIGKILTLDVLSGDYIIAEEGKYSGSIEAAREMYARHPDAALFGIRIGYNAVYAVGGSLIRTTRS